MTFGGKERFSKLGNNGVKEAGEIIRLCVDHGINLIDIANIYPCWHQAKFARETFCEGDKALFGGRYL
jgi:aryl-alcohol dehydrogenase-like predicted oxidoreductase